MANPPTPLHTQPPQSQSPQQQLFTSLESYPFAHDSDFQSGLLAILSGPSQSQNPSDLILHARCFYYARKYNVYVDANAYREWRARQPVESLASLDPPQGMLAPGSESGNAGLRDFVPTPEGTPLKAGSARRENEIGTERSGAMLMPSNQASGASNADVRPEERRPASFQEIVEMIQDGKPIPGIQEIPEIVLVGEGTGALKERRQKPWERRAQVGDTSGGLFGGG